MKLIVFFAVTVFMLTLCMLEMAIYTYRKIRYPDRGRIKQRLKKLNTASSGGGTPEILKKRIISEIPVLNALLSAVPLIGRLENLVRKANAKYTPAFFILQSLVLFVFLFFGTGALLGKTPPAVFLGAAAGSIPFVYLFSKKKRRMAKFQRQLPEGLDLIARALRAGHAFTTGMRMAADEFEDPLGPEFREALDEINFGLNIQDALRGLADRIDCEDVRYFVVSVVLQRETGGNLAEILENISHLIRERFKLRGKIRALAAEGKLSAVILVALPFLVIIALLFMNPDYIKTLLDERLGRLMAAGAGFMMLMGIVFMKKLINIRV
jgi:tight adherence protein B